jgi:hypothetical protein
MTRQEKIAWFNLAVFGVAAVVFVVLFIFIRDARPEFSLFRQIKFSSAAMGFCGFWGLNVFMFRGTDGPVMDDERDRFIQLRAVFGAHMMFWLVFVGTCMGVWGVNMVRGTEQISIHMLPMLVFLGMVVVGVTQAVVTLIMYGRGMSHDGGGV